MAISPSMIKPFTYSFIGLLYGLSLLALGWTAAGAGHGTFFFLSLAVFPFGIGFLMWPAITLLLANVHEGFYRSFFLIMIAVRYALIAIFVLRWPDELRRIPIAWEYSPSYVIEPLVLFLAGQVLLWVLFFRRSRSANNSEIRSVISR